ncbi:MAG TPA: hypothetical protein VJ874_06415, partial [Candidatus Thermoplasmatota archaeon]|nr:hypothetical protein [Candidatus Thermoplasmatota archaeon]
FGLEDGELQAEGNHTFRFTDADGDGKLSAGDSFVVSDLGEGSGDGSMMPPEEPESPEEPCDPYDPDEPCEGPCDPESSCEYEIGFDYGFASYQVVVYDRVADGEVNSGYSAMPSPAWLALAALGLAGLAVRRKR